MTSAAELIFRVPPFPGSRPKPIAKSGHQTPCDRETAVRILLKLHRERVAGEFWRSGRAPSGPVHATNPAALLQAICGTPPVVTGPGPFASLNGLAISEEHVPDAVIDRFRDEVLNKTSFFDPFDGNPIALSALIDILILWRTLIDQNRPLHGAFGIAHWKQDTLRALLWGGEQDVPFLPATTGAIARLPATAPVAIWKARISDAALAQLELRGNPIVEIEDGFIRSIGLGADCVPPLSIIADPMGIHYDPERSSTLERYLNDNNIDLNIIERAAKLRNILTASRISKYGRGGSALVRPGGTKRHILVPGQVEDDRSIRFGTDIVRRNIDLLRSVRTANPDAWIVYRPHPDVEAGHRIGRIDALTAQSIADSIDTDSAIGDLIAMVDEVHVMTSLAGFEGLMAGKAVTTYGAPFYAGWGLTTDLGCVLDRRKAQLSLDQLAAAALLVYPRYLDPVTGLPCSAENLVQRIEAGITRHNGWLVTLRRLQGRFMSLFAGSSRVAA